MKKLIKIFAALTVGTLALASCDDSWKGTLYEGPNNEAVFVTNQIEYTFTASAPSKVTVHIVRGVAKGAASVAITATGATDKLTVPATVEFADGEAEKDIEISFTSSALDFGVEYKVNLKVPDVQITTALVSCDVIVIRDYSWESAGDATVTSDFNADDDGNAAVYTVELFKDSSTPNYKLDLMGSGAMYQFTINSDNSISLKGTAIDGSKGEPANIVGAMRMDTGYKYSGLPIYTATLVGAANIADTNYNPATKTVTLVSRYIVYKGDGSYYGSFGWGAELIVLP